MRTWKSVLSQALCWPLTRKQHGRISSPLFQKGSDIPKDKRRDKEKKFTKFYSYKITLFLDLKGLRGPSEPCGGARGMAVA